MDIDKTFVRRGCECYLRRKLYIFTGIYIECVTACEAREALLAGFWLICQRSRGNFCKLHRRCGHCVVIITEVCKARSIRKTIERVAYFHLAIVDFIASRIILLFHKYSE